MRRLPVIATPDEARRIIERIDGPAQLVVSLLYGSGLRLREALELRIKDVGFDGNSLFIRSGKWQKDRMALLPNAVVDALKRQIEFAKRQHERDVASDSGWVDMPDALGRKFRHAGRSIEWQWLFPTTRIYHLGDEEPVTLQHFLDIACTEWSCRAPTRMPVWVINSAAFLSELGGSLFKKPAPLTRDFIDIGRVSYWGDTTRAREELIPSLIYPTLESGCSIL